MPSAPSTAYRMMVSTMFCLSGMKNKMVTRLKTEIRIKGRDQNPYLDAFFIKGVISSFSFSCSLLIKGGIFAIGVIAASLLIFIMTQCHVYTSSINDNVSFVKWSHVEI